MLVVKGTLQRPDPQREGEEDRTRIMTEREQAEVHLPLEEAPPIDWSFCNPRSGIAQHGSRLQRMHRVEDAEAPTTTHGRAPLAHHGIAPEPPRRNEVSRTSRRVARRNVGQVH